MMTQVLHKPLSGKNILSVCTVASSPVCSGHQTEGLTAKYCPRLTLADVYYIIMLVTGFETGFLHDGFRLTGQEYKAYFTGKTVIKV